VTQQHICLVHLMQCLKSTSLQRSMTQSHSEHFIVILLLLVLKYVFFLHYCVNLMHTDTIVELYKKVS
jgi:hypothetical protein